MLRYLFVIIFFCTGRAEALPSVHWDEASEKIYQSRVRFRNITKALIRSGQCTPGQKDFQGQMGLEYIYGCTFYYSGQWYALIWEDGQYKGVQFNEQTWSEFTAYYDSLSRLRTKRGRYPQYQNTRPTSWFRFSASRLGPIQLTDFWDLVLLEKKIRELEEEMLGPVLE